MHLDKLEVAVFDWDGTLINSRDAIIFSANKILQKADLANWHDLQQHIDSKLSFKKNFQNLLGEFSDYAWYEFCQIYEASFIALTSKFAGVNESLDFLKKQGVKLAIVTNKDRSLFTSEYQHYFPHNPFDIIVCGEEAPRDKPYPEHALYALNEVMDISDIDKHTVWFLGDSHQDFECARSIGAMPIVMGKNIHDGKLRYNVDYYHFDSFLHFSYALKQQAL